MMKLKPFSRNTGKQTPVWPVNTFQDPREVTGKQFFILTVFLISSLGFSGCLGEKYSYPAATATKSIEEICAKENKLDVQARIVGKTVGALLYVDNLVDEAGQIPKDVHEKMGKVLQAVTRVALSTDAPLDFCSAIIRDKTHTNELTITRSLDDTKRANADALGVEESLNRTLFGQGQYIKEALDTMPFPLKEVLLENFLADQIVQRIRYSFTKETEDLKKLKTKIQEDDEEKNDLGTGFVLVDGEFENVKGRKGFKFSILSMRTDDPKKTMLSVFKTVNDVLAGYRYTDFDEIEIQDYLNRQKLVLDRKTLLNYQNKKIKDSEITEKFLQESQSIQDAFKLFGFNVPPDSSENKNTALVAATP